ncbi:PIN/TRAM domain-containing protein [Candidatus Synechococcus calcipolaris G9]|uniref:PIN/TRAM domain-containing protein n=1 Tax=Candidatus Synechococcus calcipolaris G9 TaxID=1497997 RepID=A0ABT6F0R1_9SYNE|nr:PIN/TRAM domain-containing protein [Candidatus Synechococcus calcipolaris]MDG2991443.1 PIN/TRAM domain-containing protein [Candidatus Synechococcus calcipolaris G9]
MLDTLLVLIFIVAGAAVGFNSIDLLPTPVLAQVANLNGLQWVVSGFGGLVGVAIGLVIQTLYHRIEREVRQLPPDVLLSRAVGLVVGLLLANLILAPIFLLPIPKEFSFIKPLAAVLTSVLFAYSGTTLADSHGRALLNLINPHSVETSLLAEGMIKPAAAKILDTSCIIDGRIEELLSMGILEGQILVPQFVLQELQLVADASNDLKRGRGRRGLDVLNRLQAMLGDRIVIHSADYADLTTVDAKLVRLAQEIHGVLVTNDFNLNKVARFQKVQVFNVNELAQALRPIYLPGDLLQLKILKEGKEPAQGVGYLEDGTMVVVEEGIDHIGDQLPVVVTSALQTSAGRMIFARLKISTIA